MYIQNTTLKGVKMIVEQDAYERRGWKLETYSWMKYYGLGIRTLFTNDFITKVEFKNTLRGLYFQNNPLAQTLLIRCLRGSILQAVVDIRKTSKQYGKWILRTLSADNKTSLYIPAGFAQGFLTLTDDVEIYYKADQPNASIMEKVINFADPDIGIQWPDMEEEIIVSVKDKTAPMLNEIDYNYL